MAVGVTATSTRQFLGLTGAGPHWELPVVERLTGGRSGSLFGGVGLAAGVIALEEASERPVMWATGQYLATCAPGATLDLEVELPTVGRSVTQGRLRGHDGDTEVITVIGATGSRRERFAGIWERFPSTRPPAESEVVVRVTPGERDSIHRHVEVRMAQGMFGFVGTGVPSGDHRTLLWARIPDVHHDAAALALIADFLPSAVGNALGQIVSCTSLDNTIRFASSLDEIGEVEWVLCDNRIEYVGRGFAHGTALMWSERGELLATASQTVSVYERTDLAG